MQLIRNVALFVLGLVAAAPAQTSLLPVAPFQGDHTDNFDLFGNVQAVQVLDVLDGTATISNLTEDGAIKIEFSSSLGGDLVRPRSGPLMMGQLGIGRWDFEMPATRFGSYLENNSGADDATFFFYDVNDVLIDSVVADVPAAGGQWHWNGWESDTPFTRVEVVGNGLINGFIWYDDVRVSYVPEPATLALLGAAIALRRRMRPANS